MLKEILLGFAMVVAGIVAAEALSWATGGKPERRAEHSPKETKSNIPL